jgi:hypothetical protein
MKVFIPEKLDVDRMLEKVPPTDIPNFKKDELLYVLGQITHIQAYGGDKVRADGLVPIHSQTLQRVVRNYNKYLSYLTDAGVLRCEPFYTPGYGSKMYGFRPKYICRNKVYYITDTRLNAKFSKVSKKHDNAKNKHKNLWAWFRKGKLMIDKEGALACLANMYPENPPPSDDEFDGVDRRIENIVKYNAHALTVEHFYDRDRAPHFSTDVTAGRLHTPLTNLKKELRNFVSYNGAPLACLDVKNCQPYLTLLLFNPNFYHFNLRGVPAEERQFLNDLMNGTDTGSGKGQVNISSLYSCTGEHVLRLSSLSFFKQCSNSFLLCLSSLSSLIMLVNDIEKGTKKGIYGDVEHYKRHVSGGTFYDNLRELYNQETGVNNTRKDIKRLYCMVAYGKVYGLNHPASHPFYRFFANLYPTVMKVYNLFKTEDYRNFVYLLQRIEAHVILNVTCKNIAGSKPGAPLYTIHDGLVTTVANVKFVQQVMEQVLFRMVGVKPLMKTEYWSSEAITAHT